MASTVSLRRARLQSVIAMQARAAAAADPLEIRDIRLYPLREPDSERRYSLVRLEARSGLIGWGECSQVSPRELALVRAALPGISASAYQVAWQRLAQAPVLRAGIDIALLDILGQHTKAPVYQVLGGPTRFKARALAQLEGSQTPQLVEALERALKAGHRAFSMPVPEPAARNQGQAFVRETAARLDALRKAAGENASFVLDGGAKLTPGDASSLAAEFERQHLLWFDEPCASASFGALRKLTSECVTPIGFGRSLAQPSAFQDLLREEAADVLRPNLAVYGISHSRLLAALGEANYVAVAPYHEGGPVSTAAAMHLAASLPNFFAQQVPLAASDAGRRMRQELAGVDLESPKDGYLELPASPGLGVKINEGMLNRYKDETA